MRSILVTIALLVQLNSNSQTFKKLKVFTTDSFNAKASITVMALENDNLIAVGLLKNALVTYGFKVISEKVAQDKIEINKKKQQTDTTSIEEATLSRTTYINSIYAITINYQARTDTGCGGYVMSNMTGQIVDLANEGEIVATFSFEQGNLEGKCTSDVMNALALKLKEVSK